MANIAQDVRDAAEQFRDLPAVEQIGMPQSSFAQLHEQVVQTAAWMKASGVSEGDRVLLFMGNCPEFVQNFYAALWVGAVIVPVNAKLHERELSTIIADAEPELVLADHERLATAVQANLAAPSSFAAVKLVQSEAETPATGIDLPDLCPRKDDDLAWLFYTSGTTGAPKGAVLTHRSLAIMAQSYLEEINAVEPGDSILHAAPMSHGSGMYMIPHIRAGSCQLIPRSGGFDEAEMVGICSQRSEIALFAAPTMVHRLLDHCARDTSGCTAETLRRGIKCLTYGGGPMLLDTARRARALLGTRLTQIYGQGESPMTITRLVGAAFEPDDCPLADRALSSVGQPFARMQVRIDGATKAGESGEILVRGPLVMQGYWRNEQATSQTLADGWLHTGDAGYFDDAGNLHLSDRIKDVIICGGSNIYSREVEDVLIDHPGVSEAAVIGRPSTEWGEEVVAFIVPAGPDLSLADLDRHCLASLARFKRPRAYILLDAIGKNAYGKTDKKALRQIIGL